MVSAGQTVRLLLATLVLLAVAGKASAAGLEADMVIYNGKIATLDSPNLSNYRTVEAAAIHGGKFVAVGTEQEVMEYAGPGTKKVNLAGRLVIPGLIETHDHIYGYSAHFFPEGTPRPGLLDPPIDLSNIDVGMTQLYRLAQNKKPGEWIVTSVKNGRTMILELALMRGEISRFDLDKVTPDNPVQLQGGSTDQGLVNTKALNLLLERYPNLPGIIRDDKGVPTGHVKGTANLTITYEFWSQVPPHIPAPYYKMEMEEVAAQGLTTVSSRLFPNDLAVYSWLHGRGEMPIRMAYSLEAASRSNNPYAIISRLVGLQGGSGDNMWGSGDDKLWVVGLSPVSIDSVPGSGGSCISQEYPMESFNFGLWRYRIYGPNGLCRLVDPNYTDAQLIRAAAQYGFRIAGMHSGGDLGIDQFLDIVEEMSKEYPDISERRWSIDHCRFLTDAHARRAKQFGIMFSCGPKYVYAGERGDIGAYSEIYNRETAQNVVVPLRRLLDHGLVTTIQLDQHAFHPFLALQVAVNRKDISGNAWGTGQRVSRLEALYMYTRWGAEYVLGEKKLGSIETGKLADFLVMERDYFTVPEDEIGRLDPVMTVVGGNVVYTQPAFASSAGLPVTGYQGSRSAWLRGTPDDANKRRGGGGE